MKRKKTETWGGWWDAGKLRSGQQFAPGVSVAPPRVNGAENIDGPRRAIAEPLSTIFTIARRRDDDDRAKRSLTDNRNRARNRSPGYPVARLPVQTMSVAVRAQNNFEHRFHQKHLHV